MNSAQMGRGGVRAFDLDVGVVVVAHPDDAEQVAGEAGEPRIVAGAGFARCRSINPMLRAHAGQPVPSPLQHGFHHVRGEEGHARIEHLACVVGV